MIPGPPNCPGGKLMAWMTISRTGSCAGLSSKFGEGTLRASGNQPAANILDHQPMVNIKPFGMCMTLSNPQVALATSAAQGVLTPQPCIPMTHTPWAPGAPTLLVGNMPAVDNTCTCMCVWGGVVSVMMPGQFTEMIP